jgi:hypothetical protein
MIERRKTPRKDWVVGQDDVGQAILEWKVDSRYTGREDSDPLARTYDFLKRLDVPDLSLEVEVDAGGNEGCDPYDTSSRLRFPARR